MVTLLRYQELDSTNSEMARRLDTLPHLALIKAHSQSAGRGQRGNSWEAEPGMNVTMSLLLREPAVEPRRQFVISEAVALAVAMTVEELTGRSDVAVKWPNDIYVADKKIAGILIECGISGSSLSHAIIGIGLNVNQTIFRSPTPNPVSVAALTGRSDYDTERIALAIAGRIESLTARAAAGEHDAIHSLYLRSLWRREGVHPWRRRADGMLFRASIAGISPEGFLTLLPEGADTPLPPFAFKEVEAIL